MTENRNHINAETSAEKARWTRRNRKKCLSLLLCGGGKPTQYCTLGEVVSCIPRGEGILSRGQSWWQLVSKRVWVAIQLHNHLAGGSS